MNFDDAPAEAEFRAIARKWVQDNAKASLVNWLP